MSKKTKATFKHALASVLAANHFSHAAKAPDNEELGVFDNLMAACRQLEPSIVTSPNLLLSDNVLNNQIQHGASGSAALAMTERLAHFQKTEDKVISRVRKAAKDVHSAAFNANPTLLDDWGRVGTSFVNRETHVFVHLWKDKFAAGRFHKAFSLVSETIAMYRISGVHIPLTYKTLIEGQAVTVTVLPPLLPKTGGAALVYPRTVDATDEDAETPYETMLELMVTQLRHALGLHDDVQLTLHRGADGRHYLINPVVVAKRYALVSDDAAKLGGQAMIRQEAILRSQEDAFSTDSARKQHCADGATAAYVVEMLLPDCVEDLCSTIRARPAPEREVAYLLQTNFITTKFHRHGVNMRLMRQAEQLIMGNPDHPTELVTAIRTEMAARVIARLVSFDLAKLVADGSDSPAQRVDCVNRIAALITKQSDAEEFWAQHVVPKIVEKYGYPNKDDPLTWREALHHSTLLRKISIVCGCDYDVDSGRFQSFTSAVELESSRPRGPAASVGETGPVQFPGVHKSKEERFTAFWTIFERGYDGSIETVGGLAAATRAVWCTREKDSKLAKKAKTLYETMAGEIESSLSGHFGGPSISLSELHALRLGVAYLALIPDKADRAGEVAWLSSFVVPLFEGALCNTARIPIHLQEALAAEKKEKNDEKEAKKRRKSDAAAAPPPPPPPKKEPSAPFTDPDTGVPELPAFESPFTNYTAHDMGAQGRGGKEDSEEDDDDAELDGTIAISHVDGNVLLCLVNDLTAAHVGTDRELTPLAVALASQAVANFVALRNVVTDYRLNTVVEQLYERIFPLVTTTENETSVRGIFLAAERLGSQLAHLGATGEAIRLLERVLWRSVGGPAEALKTTSIMAILVVEKMHEWDCVDEHDRCVALYIASLCAAAVICRHKEKNLTMTNDDAAVLARRHKTRDTMRKCMERLRNVQHDQFHTAAANNVPLTLLWRMGELLRSSDDGNLFGSLRALDNKLSMNRSLRSRSVVSAMSASTASLEESSNSLSHPDTPAPENIHIRNPVLAAVQVLDKKDSRTRLRLINLIDTHIKKISPSFWLAVTMQRIGRGFWEVRKADGSTHLGQVRKQFAGLRRCVLDESYERRRIEEEWAGANFWRELRETEKAQRKLAKKGRLTGSGAKSIWAVVQARAGASGAQMRERRHKNGSGDVTPGSVSPGTVTPQAQSLEATANDMGLLDPREESEVFDAHGNKSDKKLPKYMQAKSSHKSKKKRSEERAREALGLGPEKPEEEDKPFVMPPKPEVPRMQGERYVYGKARTKFDDRMNDRTGGRHLPKKFMTFSPEPIIPKSKKLETKVYSIEEIRARVEAAENERHEFYVRRTGFQEQVARKKKVHHLNPLTEESLENAQLGLSQQPKRNANRFEFSASSSTARTPEPVKQGFGHQQEQDNQRSRPKSTSPQVSPRTREDPLRSQTPPAPSPHRSPQRSPRQSPRNEQQQQKSPSPQRSPLDDTLASQGSEEINDSKDAALLPPQGRRETLLPDGSDSREEGRKDSPLIETQNPPEESQEEEESTDKNTPPAESAPESEQQPAEAQGDIEKEKQEEEEKPAGPTVEEVMQSYGSNSKLAELRAKRAVQKQKTSPTEPNEPSTSQPDEEPQSPSRRRSSARKVVVVSPSHSPTPVPLTTNDDDATNGSPSGNVDLGASNSAENSMAGTASNSLQSDSQEESTESDSGLASRKSKLAALRAKRAAKAQSYSNSE